MNTRLMIIFGAAILMAVGVAFLTRQILQPPAKALDVKVLAATHDLTVGTKVTKADLMWQNWSSDNVSSLYITDGKPSDVDKILDAIVRYTVVKGEPILASKFVHPNDKSLLSAIIEPGKRAFTLQMGKRSNLTALISPGDSVDIVFANKSNARNQNSMGQTIIRKVPVIATDGRLARDDTIKNPEPPEEVTIMVTPEQAERLAAALQDGKPTITVYSLTSSQITEIPPEEDTEPKVEEAPPAALSEPQPEQTSSKREHNIAVMRGSQATNMSFEVEDDQTHNQHPAHNPMPFSNHPNNNNIFTPNPNSPSTQSNQGRM